MTCSRVFASTLLLGVTSAIAQQAAERTTEQILKSITLPAGYEATVFAKAPQLGYPTSISASPEGTIFVAVDENGSLDRAQKRGRVVRLRDTNGDDIADEQKVFAEMDSPRGVIWDGAKGTGPGALYVMHPPNLTAYYDDNGDGVADRQEDLVTGLGFDLGFRGADHTTNGARLAIDGFIYIAVGDYGYVEARGKDGTVLKNRGGGIVRVRPDGSGLEIVSRGQRNIYDVAVSPTLDLFTRDNTNDGGGWDVRLSAVPPGAHMGYPYYFKNFAEDMLQPLADYGGGSPCGALWIDEPGLQSGLYTVEWGRNGIMQHGLKRKGAGWEVDGPKQGQTEWLKLTRPTDMDVDAQGAIYVTSWEGATFNYNGPNAGYILRLTRGKGTSPQDLAFASGGDTTRLLQEVAGKSSVVRQAAQRELLRRARTPADHAQLAEQAIGALRAQLANASSTEDGPLVALIQTVAQLDPRTAVPVLLELTKNERAREFVLQALGDLPALAAQIPTRALTTYLSDANPRIRVNALTALRRLKKTDSAVDILPLVADGDVVIAHLAVRALRELKAVEPCLSALDSSDEKVKPGAIQALYGMYEPEVVQGLLSRLTASKGETRRGILNALCRLDNQDEIYVDPKVWWGTRPDTSGPVYKPVKWAESDRIEAALKQIASTGPDDEARWLLQRMYRTKINFPGLIELMLAKAGSDIQAKLLAIEGLFSADNVLPSDALIAAQGVATDEKQNPELRARALRLIQRANQLKANPAGAREAALKAAVAAYGPLVGHDLPHPALTAAVEDFTHAAPGNETLGAFERMAVGNDQPSRVLAQTILLNAATSAVLKGKEKESAEHALDRVWKQPEASATLLGVIARTKAKSLAPQVRAHLKDPNNAVAEAALFAYQSLGLTEGAPAAQLIATMKYEDVAGAAANGGDVAQGKEMFLRAGCVACHTVSENEPPKGPMLAATAKIYDRAKLTESILKPNASIAQGFESQWFKTKKGEQIEGFVTREGGDSVDVRNIAGQTVTVEKGDLAERGKRETSMMPEGLLNGFSPAELASLLAYLESLKGK